MSTSRTSSTGAISASSTADCPRLRLRTVPRAPRFIALLREGGGFQRRTVRERRIVVVDRADRRKVDGNGIRDQGSVCRDAAVYGVIEPGRREIKSPFISSERGTDNGIRVGRGCRCGNRAILKKENPLQVSGCRRGQRINGGPEDIYSRVWIG